MYSWSSINMNYGRCFFYCFFFCSIKGKWWSTWPMAFSRRLRKETGPFSLWMPTLTQAESGKPAKILAICDRTKSIKASSSPKFRWWYDNDFKKRFSSSFEKFNPKDLDLEWKQYYGFYHEDGFFCCHHRSKYESVGCKFAPIEVAAQFSHETMVAENYGNIPFGFHGRNNYYYHITQKSL